MPEDLQIDAAHDTPAQKQAKIQEAITRQHIATAANLSRPEVIAATQTTPEAYDAYMQKNVLAPTIETYGPDSVQVRNTQKGV